MTPDLDALDALLAAATAAKGDGRWRDENTKVNAQMDYLTAVHDPDIIISLIEAARREAGLREALTLTLDAYDEVMATDLSGISHLEAVSARATLGRTLGEKVRSLLHDNAGATARAALPAEGTGP